MIKWVEKISALETIVGTMYWTVAMSIYKKLYANPHISTQLRAYRVKPVFTKWHELDMLSHSNP